MDQNEPISVKGKQAVLRSGSIERRPGVVKGYFQLA